MGYYQNIAELIYFLANIQINNIRFSIKTIVLAGILLFASFSNISEAATGTCFTCNGSPASISQINTMTRELLNTIKTVGTEVPYAGKPVSPVWFEDGYFNPPKTSILSKTLRWARESLGSLLAVGRIFININKYGATEALDSKLIIAKGKIYKRDWTKLEDVGQEIANKKFALSVGGGRNDPIRNKTYKKIQEILTRYQDGGLLSKDSTITQGVTYSDILGMLENLNIMAKHQIVSTNSSKLTQNLGDNGLLIKISKTAVESIAQAYLCVKEQKCDSSWKQLGKDLEGIINMGKSGVGKVGQDISKTTTRLANAMVGVVKDIGKGTKNIYNALTKKQAEEIGMSEDEYKALKSRYGLSATQMKNAGASGYKNDKWRSQRQTIKKGFTDMVGTENIKEKIDDLVLTSKNLNTGYPQEESFKLTMITSAQDILNEAGEQRDYVLMAQNADILTRFGLLNTQLTELNDIVSNKESGLTKILGDACENQCSNISSKKCFY